jgi:hypothetical protein
MPIEHKKTSESPLASAAEGVLADVEKHITEHAELLREEVKGELRRATAAAASLGTGAGLAALGGIMGSLLLVHLLRGATRLPLWACYGLAAGALGGAGAALLVSGGREFADLSLIPRQAAKTLKEDVRWAKEQAPPARA